MKNKLLKRLRKEANKRVLLVRCRETGGYSVTVNDGFIASTYLIKGMGVESFMLNVLAKLRREFILGQLDAIKPKVIK